MKANFPACVAEVLRWEGGFVDHPKDPGGATNMGLTIGTMRRLGMDIDGDGDVDKRDVRLVPVEKVRDAYRREYWDQVQGDALPGGLDHIAFDGGVNSSPARGIRWLQAGLGVAQDGQIGRVTMAAAKNCDSLSVIRAATRARMGFLRGLKTWVDFGRGWTNRVTAAEAFATRLAIASAPEAKRELTRAADAAEAQAKREGRKAGGAVVAGGGATQAPTQIPDMPQLPDWGMAVAGVAILVIVLLFLGNRIIEKRRAAAHRAVAEGVKA